MNCGSKIKFCIVLDKHLNRQRDFTESLVNIVIIISGDFLFIKSKTGPTYFGPLKIKFVDGLANPKKTVHA